MSPTVPTPVVRVSGLPAGERTSTPVKWWAAVGALFVALQASVYLRWIFSQDFERVSPGPDPIPLSFRIMAHTAEILVMGLMVFGIYRYLLRPWREQRSVSVVGMMWIASLTTYFWDWSINWAAPVGNYTGAFWFNMGSWYSYIPGWISPNGTEVAELSSFGVPGVICVVGIGSVLVAGAMRKFKSRWPQISRSGLILGALATGILLDLVAEALMVRAGLYTFSGSIPALTLFSGHYYQLPIYEALLFGPVWGLMGSLVYFTDDRGQTWAERGLDQLRLSPKRRGVVRFLAFAGFLNVLLVVFTLAWILITVQPAFQWTGDTVGKRSYLIQGICGPGTEVACPAEGLPLPRGKKHSVRPDGSIVEDGRVVGTRTLKYE